MTDKERQFALERLKGLMPFGRRKPTIPSDIPLSKEAAERKRAQAYLEILKSIESSPDPVGTSLRALFSQNTIDSQAIEKMRLTAGVEMYFYDETGERREKLPQSFKDLVETVFPGRKVQVDEITVLKHRASLVSSPAYEPYVTIKISPDQETASPAEKQTGWVISKERDRVTGGVLHLTERDASYSLP